MNQNVVTLFGTQKYPRAESQHWRQVSAVSFIGIWLSGTSVPLLR